MADFFPMAFVAKIFFYCLLPIGLFVAYVRFLESTSVFFPERVVAATPRDLQLPYEDVSLVTEDGVSLNGWFVQAPSDNLSTLTILFLHGNAGNIGDRLDKIQMFHRFGANVFIIDYRGFGKSTGKPTEKGMYIDSRTAFDFLTKRAGIVQENIVVYGESLGGVAGVDLAVHRPVAGLILDSTLSSAADMGKVIFPLAPSFILSIKLDSMSKIKNVKAPKLHIHSPNDEMVPFAFGKKLFDAGDPPKEFLQVEGGHNDGYSLSREKFSQGIQSFLERYGFLKKS